MLGRIISPLRAFNPQARIFFAVIVGLSLVVDGLYSVLLNLVPAAPGNTALNSSGWLTRSVF